jgi:hypothetical protein
VTADVESAESAAVQSAAPPSTVLRLAATPEALGNAGVYPTAADLASVWTWWCSVGDDHPTDAGHQAIADTVLDLL